MKIRRRTFLGMTAAFAAAPTLSACGGYDRVPVEGVPRSSFGKDATAEQVTEGIDLKGKYAVVTGCTSGIGYETMRVLAKRGATVFGTSRSLERATAAGKSVVGMTIPLRLDLSDFESVVECAEQIRSINMPIDMLVLNAGYRGGGNRRVLLNGIEKHFLVNHLGHFLLFNQLADRLYYAWQGRVVVVASRAAYRTVPDSGIQFEDLEMISNYSDALAYGRSKLANVLFSLELGKLLRGTRITSNALHPGVINTEIDRNINPVLQFGFGVLTAINGKNVEEGAATSCFVATSPSLGSTSGRYFEDCNAVDVPDTHMQNMEMADRLWLLSEELTRPYYKPPEVHDWSDFENGLPRQKSES